MVDARALRALEPLGSWRFESSPRHRFIRNYVMFDLILRSVAQLVERLVWDEEVPGPSPGTPTLHCVQCKHHEMLSIYFTL